MSTREDIEEFEEQLRLQKTPVNEDSVTRTRVDSDGTEMEWDEKRKAWYQMNYGFKNDSAEPDPTQSLVLGDAWSVHARRLEELRRERGESDKEVLALQKASEESLAAYYSSPAYKAWYSMYIKVKGDGTASCDNQVGIL
ncbi:unnamed protein product [Protopolystoma xenopodis]|uniref:Uncharacterized protein n=1 Tax=Protopolystoma xenopodis TaxID=117903 RepID=A0A448X5U9_9PLAT|nr:unnamed protein product [Protopolystoma xenopodis]